MLPTPVRRRALDYFLGVGGSGRRPVESADPQVRRVGRLGKRTERKLFERKLRNLVLGDWGLGFPW